MARFHTAASYVYTKEDIAEMLVGAGSVTADAVKGWRIANWVVLLMTGGLAWLLAGNHSTMAIVVAILGSAAVISGVLVDIGTVLHFRAILLSDIAMESHDKLVELIGEGIDNDEEHRMKRFDP